MLKPAILYKEEVNKLHAAIWFDDKYKYYNYNMHWSLINANEDTRDWHEFVSVDKNGKVIGLITYYVYRGPMNATSFGAINYTDDKITFGKDLLQVIDDIFMKFNLNKLNFSCVIGNPAEKSYDRLCHKYGGRILCIEKRETKLQDNLYYDVKRYEIMREDYINARRSLIVS